MITTLEAVDIVVQQLIANPIKTAINGVIARQRPLNSKKEDVIVNSLPINARQLQEGLVNVNIHVPNLTITVNGVQDNTQPNSARLKELADIAAEVLTDNWPAGTDVNFTIQQQSLFDEPESNSHYVNFRLLFYAVTI